MQQELIKSLHNDCLQSLCDYQESLEVLRNQVILVTGGTGFMGKWIAEAVSLLNEEYNFNIKLYLLARNIDNYKDEVPHLADKPFLHLIEQDVRNVNNLPEDIKWIIHAASSPDSREHISNPLKTIDTIYKGTQALLESCLRLPELTKFLYISSNYVYGQVYTETAYIKENHFGFLDSNSVSATYGEAKRLAETVCAIYRNQQQFPIVTVRPFAFLGPYQSLEKPWAINNFIRDSILGGPIRILGNENTIRSYLYGSDVAFWLLKILAQAKTGATYNLGGEEPISLHGLSKKITSNFNNKIDVIIKSSKQPSTSPVLSVPDITAIKRDIGVKQVFSLDKAISKTIEWHKTVNQKS
ncbi:NAD-dependent epimerase/dehydratase family protein [Mucilaginibacter agri]|uniref:NAD-dependent epimerase/dehydratase family protein n=1 Tax=Mucilaginibacter agri TaxID=2695265 RepID=A0A966DVQ2_9SPHI|nr:NAD-dependent epimerase/dehydratase family protein [Mucilaginibacter agri]NCD70749.1 NAD-dependent epimerase/dehydratase family protein [Mucilaginibacter agri]